MTTRNLLPIVILLRVDGYGTVPLRQTSYRVNKYYLVVRSEATINWIERFLDSVSSFSRLPPRQRASPNAAFGTFGAFSHQTVPRQDESSGGVARNRNIDISIGSSSSRTLPVC